MSQFNNPNKVNEFLEVVKGERKRVFGNPESITSEILNCIEDMEKEWDSSFKAGEFKTTDKASKDLKAECNRLKSNITKFGSYLLTTIINKVDDPVWNNSFLFCNVFVNSSGNFVKVINTRKQKDELGGFGKFNSEELNKLIKSNTPQSTAPSIVELKNILPISMGCGGFDSARGCEEYCCVFNEENGKLYNSLEEMERKMSKKQSSKGDSGYFYSDDDGCDGDDDDWDEDDEDDDDYFDEEDSDDEFEEGDNSDSFIDFEEIANRTYLTPKNALFPFVLCTNTAVYLINLFKIPPAPMYVKGNILYNASGLDILKTLPGDYIPGSEDSDDFDDFFKILYVGICDGPPAILKNQDFYKIQGSIIGITDFYSFILENEKKNPKIPLEKRIKILSVLYDYFFKKSETNFNKELKANRATLNI